MIHSEYNDLISIKNLFQAWNEFKKGKRNRKDVQLFEINLEDNIFSLHKDLVERSYKHGGYQSFYINDPKERHIHKANVSDRIVHRILYNYLYCLWNDIFIHDSYSCRLDKGLHKAALRLSDFGRKVSKNYTSSSFALKCDITKFFDSLDHEVLLGLLKVKTKDRHILKLLSQIISSFYSENHFQKGIPLGNLTSQIFANIYLNELDQFIKHFLKVKYYIRYADDFIVLSTNNSYLVKLIPQINNFLELELKLSLNISKTFIKKANYGIDFLGYIILPYFILPRTKTKKRIFRKISAKAEDLIHNKTTVFSFNQTIQSYLGYLKHANSYKLTCKIRKLYSHIL